MGRVSSFLLLIVHTWLLQTQARRRNLTEITYRFTSCGSTNHKGPMLNMCRPLYEQMDSPIATPSTLFQFPDGSYDGAQGFRIPRDDLYNITIAGASGGEGVCNFHYGHGGMISAQVRLTTDYEYLILVGHRGSSVCDLPENSNHSICQLPRPTNLTEAQVCDQSWLNWTMMSANGSDIYAFNGGGGGGGASTVWPRRVDNQVFTTYPIAIAPGGGGASAVLDYEGFVNLDILNFLDFRYPAYVNTTDSREVYQYHVDGHETRYLYENLPEGMGGLSVSSTHLTSGVGGGWLPSLDSDADGNSLSQEHSFAEGGFDCSSLTFTNVFGGYGGGGGGCGSGGGGGGYTGGHVVEGFNYVPGSGGDVGVFTTTQFPILGETVPFNFNDDAGGFVEIVASNCGCVEDCVLYTEEKEFECTCPNRTLLADDLRSCYQERNVSFVEEDPLTFEDIEETFYINGLQFEESFFVFGLDVSLTVTPEPGSSISGQDMACAVVFIGSDFQSVLASNPVSSIVGTGRAHNVTILGNTTEGVGPSTDYVPFLAYPILVTGALLLTNGQCSLSSPLQVNISSESDTPPLQNSSAFNSLTDSEVVTLARLILELPPSTNDTITPSEGSVTPSTNDTTTPSEGSLAPNTNDTTTPSGGSVAVNTDVLIGLVITACILITAIIVVTLLVVYFRRWRRSRKHKRCFDLSTIPEALSVERHLRLQSLTQYTTSTSISNPLATFEEPKLLTDSDEQHYKKVFCSILIPYSSLTVNEKIGQGAFGVVFRGELRRPESTSTEDIAIKTIKNSGSSTEVKAFFEESLLMKDFDHQNILGLAGVCFDTPDGVPYILLPFMANGSLKDYLKTKRTHVTNVDTLPKEMHVSTLVRMCMDIATGMEYLAREKFVHRDLAARNCMVDASLLIKVGDFGLARDVYSSDYYKASKEAMIPVKWMAPETLLDGISNEKTDVWSFGVTCWEVFSLGRAPYPGISNKDILKHITAEKERLERPSLCPEQVYTLVMSRCWKLLPEDRLTFSELVSELQEYWEEQHAYVIELTD